MRDNARSTYLGLVENIEGAVMTRPSNFSLVRGPGNFSFCNFSVGFDGDESEAGSTAEMLVQNGHECASFCVFLSSADNLTLLRQELVEHGFRERQSLASMASTVSIEVAPVELIEHKIPQDRLSVAKFMARQFFGWMSRDSQDAIALATALSRHKIYSVGASNQPSGAVMLVESEGVIGLYNLCVQEKERGKGLGSNIVRAVQSLASKNSCPVGILCERSLISWYQYLEFERVGSIDVFCCDA